jgi:ankyrin repeat protein
LLGIQSGKTKVFLQRKAFEALEYLRCRKLEEAARSIQSMYRMRVVRSLYIAKLDAVKKIQDFARKLRAYTLMREQRIRAAVIVVQRTLRCLTARRWLFSARLIACWCQSAYRGAIARQYCAYLFLDKNAFSIQRTWRRYCLTSSFRKFRKYVVLVQNRHRSRLAFRALSRLRREARDLDIVAAERAKFKEESRRLRQQLEIVQKNSPLKPKQSEKEGEIQKLRHEVQRLHFELEKAHRMHSPSRRNEEISRRLIEELADKEDELDRLKRELDGLRSRDECSSVRSITVATSHASEFSYRFSRPSPVRSDTSLIDNEAYEYISKIDINGDRPEDSSNSSGVEKLQQLHNAIRQGDVRLIDHILLTTSEPCVLINQGDKYGRTAIHIAALSLNKEITESLIAKGAVVNAQDDDGETPLHLAENSETTEILLAKGKANPNIPNVDGICALHLAVQRRDLKSVRQLLKKNANVNNADNVRWFTSLHLIALPSRLQNEKTDIDDMRLRIAHLLISTNRQSIPDLNYQDSEGNTPLHYAAQLETQDCCDLISLFLESGAKPNIRNIRDQIPLHLLCHNAQLRKRDNFQEIIHIMLMHGADPNLQSLTGCTPLHLSLYHKDIDTAAQLVHSGAELHQIWKKPKRWPSFWKDMGSSRVVALDMVDDSIDTFRILSAIVMPHKLAPARSWCMNCKIILGRSSRCLHCRHCSRLICDACTHSCLSSEYFPKSFKVTSPSWVCVVCERILTSQKEVLSNVTHPISSYGDDDEDDRYSC